ncbi:unnamed protein product [Cuscuta europaea]|uniref:Cytochrome b5 heme-binding domain-containing protein n=1 Tax=Cuscuta europaea TaxID=41803 RepID=A0A9P0ZZ77_CUSEU|nr:unnamed protein product [Cuscuta europaea]
MANDDDDFTFCQVVVHNDQEGTGEEKVVQDVSGIRINDDPSNHVASSENTSAVGHEKSCHNANLKKQETGCSLSINTIDSSEKQVSESSNPGASEGTETSLEALQNRINYARKPAPRAKVPFEKGYSQMDWLRLTATHPDLAGTRGESNRRLITINEVKQHQSEGSMWTVLKGRVYNISPYMKFHPGGVDMLMKAVGKDCTFLFNKYHAWVNAEFLLEKCLVGILDESQ